MMSEEIFRSLVLAFIQGLSEFLPVSSSAHLILPAELGAWPDQGLAFDISVHVGTLLAVLHYFRRELTSMLGGLVKATAEKQMNQDAKLAFLLAVSTVPVVIAGFVFKDLIDTQLRSAEVIAVTSIVFGILLYLSDRLLKKTAGLESLTWKHAVIIGLAQMLALIPGTSRSGVTMTAALFCQLDRVSASRYSFLLSIPAIAGAGLLLGIDLAASESVNWLLLFTGALVSGVVAWLTIHFFLRVIEKAGFLPFVIYRVLLGIVLLVLFV